MSTAVRPPKSGGTTRYTDEVARGFDVIKATEVDGDLDMLVQSVNSITDANVANGASINGTKIGTGTLPADRIVPGTITDTQISGTANISGTKLLNNSVQGAKIVADSITARELATFPIVRQVAPIGPATNLSFSTVETPVVTWPVLAFTAGSHVILFGTWNLTLEQAGSTGIFPIVTVKIYRGATPLYEVKTTVEFGGVSFPTYRIPMPAPVAYHLEEGGAAAYQINMFTNAGHLTVKSAGLFSGLFHLVELAGSIG